MPKGEGPRDRKLSRQRAVLDLVRDGVNVYTALEKIGVPQHTFSTRWKKDPAFARPLAELLAKQPSAAAKRRLKQAQVPDFLTFREAHFAYFSKKLQKWVRAENSWYVQDGSGHIQANDRLIMVLAPGHLKTTVFAIEQSVWSIMRDRNWRGLHISKSQEEAAKVVASVQEKLECPYYHYIMEQLKEQGDEPITCPVCAYGGSEGFRPPVRKTGQGWGQLSFKVNGRTSGEKDHTFEAKGFGSQIQGIRSDRITIDDLQDPNSAMRSAQDSTDKLEWVRAVILGRLADEQQLVVLANFFAPEDFAHLLIEAMPDWPVIAYSAVRECPDEHCPGDDVCVHQAERVLCPEFWNWDALVRKRKEVGEQTWFFTWMQEEGSFEDTTFKREVLEDSRTGEYRLGEVPHACTHVFLGVDPATAPSGHCAIVVWGLDNRTKQRYLIDIFNEKGMRNYGNIIAQLEEYARRYEPRKVVIEQNAQQKGGLISEVGLQRSMRNLGVRVEPYQTVTGTGGRAKATNFDITTIGGLFDGGLISLPYGGTDADNAKVDAYITQLCHWRTDDDGHSIKKLKRDMVMATLFAESEAR
jgi:hypothetical protein